MSRLGRRPVIVPDKVTVSSEARGDRLVLTVEGPLGRLVGIVPGELEIAISGNEILVGAPEKDRGNAGHQGLVRATLGNMIVGVTEGYARALEIHGVGYKAELKGDVLTLIVGYSHHVHLTVPEGVTVKIEKQVDIKVSGCDKQVVTSFAARIRAVKKPEPYKGKGIRYKDEAVRRKAGKKAGGK